MADELDVLLDKVDDPALRADLRAAVDRVRAKRSFGLVFESHLPERVRLPDHPLRRGVRVVRRDGPDDDTTTVTRVRAGRATVTGADGEEQVLPVCDLVVVAEFGQPIYPGLTRLGSIDRGGDKAAQIVINGENHHALEALQFTHAGRIDCIYIDPPYNTGARDWTYDNDYVDSDDAYRHSKWLAFMERRLKLAKHLLNPDDSVLIITIDEKEFLRLGLLLEQMFIGARIQMISSMINPASVARPGSFGRSDEYIFFVMFGDALPQRVRLGRDWVSAHGRTHTGSIRWDMLRRSGPNAARSDRPGLFYPIYVDPTVPAVVAVGEPLAKGAATAAPRPGCVAVLPIRRDGSEGNWQASPATLRDRIAQGRVRITGTEKKGFTVSVLKKGEYDKIAAGEYRVTGRNADGSILVSGTGRDTVLTVPGSQWRVGSHDATQYGSRLLSEVVLPGRRFPFPKSLYAVEDTIRFFVASKPDAVVLDFFAGSGTTSHAVMRLNKQDGGRRQSILVTNNEVAAEEARSLRERGLQPGDEAWETQGIFESITRPRVTSAVTGRTPEGDPIKGDYRFVDVFPLADGFEENVEFLKLTYLDPVDVELDRAFAAVAPLMWMRAGGQGPVIEHLAGTDGGRRAYATTERYGVLFDPDHWRAFVGELPATASTAFIVTDSPATFAGVVESLPTGVEAVRLYENYLTTFAINQGRQ